MKFYPFLLLLLLSSCQPNAKVKETTIETPVLSLEIANQLAELPLECIEQEYPNKLGQVIASEDDLAAPAILHPTFYGCFDWHSSVHGHWSLIKLLKEFPNLEKADTVKSLLLKQLSNENITQEIEYFKKEYNKTYERTYGWAWLLKLTAELHSWDDPIARELENNLQPLSSLIANEYIVYLPKLRYPIRVGTHTNTAFGLSFAFDYAEQMNDTSFVSLISKRARDFYLKDAGCPIDWEPSGYDFLSPCLEEIDIMRKILPENEFMIWIHDFLPQIEKKDFHISVGEVSDRTDGHLVHLDGVNFSRAWCLYALANEYENFDHLKKIADEHLNYSFPNLVGDSYEGGHWLASFAINAHVEME